LRHPQPQPRAFAQRPQGRGQRDPGQDVVRRHGDEGHCRRRRHQADGQGLGQLPEREQPEVHHQTLRGQCCQMSFRKNFPKVFTPGSIYIETFVNIFKPFLFML